MALAVFIVSQTASAQTCSFTITNVAFGNIDVTTGGNYDTTGTLSASCTSGQKSGVIRFCAHLGPGSGGAGANASPRIMLSGANALNYNLFSNSARSVIWGSEFAGWSGAPPPILSVATDSKGAGGGVYTIYGRVNGSQNTAVVGAYASSFSGLGVIIRYANGTGSCPGAKNEGTASFTASATVQAQCTVSATNLNFGSAGLITAVRDASNTLSIVCTNNVPYTVSLGGGLSGATDPTQRKMTLASGQITYGLYRDSPRALPWGASIGVNTAAGTGTGAAQNYAVYGRVPVQATPAPGTYTDTVVVTVTY